MPALGVSQEASHRELHWGGFCSVVNGCFDGEVSGFRRLRRVVVGSADRANDGHRGAPLLWQVATIFVEVIYVRRVHNQVR